MSALRALIFASAAALLVVMTTALGAGSALAAAEPPPSQPAPPSANDEPPPITTTSEPASGFSQPRFELIDMSAWTLRDGELEVGPTDVHYGILDLFQIGTRFGLNLVGALNADAKWTIHDGERVGVSLEGGLVRFDSHLVGVDDDFAVWAFPVAFRVSGRPSDVVRLHAAIEFLSSKSGGDSSDAVKRIERYAGPVGRLAAHLGVEWRLGEHVGLLAELEAPLLEHRQIFRYDGEDDALAFLRAKLSLQIVYESLNLRLGGGYGPSFLGKSGPFPIVELALRIF